MNSIKHTLRYLFCFVIALLTAVLMTNIKKELFTEEDNIPGILLESAVGNGRNSKFLRMKDVAKALDKLSGNNKTTAQRNLLLLTRKLIEHRNLPLDVRFRNPSLFHSYQFGNVIACKSN